MGTSNLSLGLIWSCWGFLLLRDGILFDKDQQGQELKRRFRISHRLSLQPYPSKELKRFNQFLQKGARRAHRPLSIGEKEEEARELEILVHTWQQLIWSDWACRYLLSGEGHFLRKLRSFSERLFGTIGDGVLFKVDKEPYIELCKRESKTLFGYSLSLTEEENQQ